jgi:uncharacterized caspase-like protein
VELEVTLQEGENVLRVVAAHAQAASEPAQRKIFYRPRPGMSTTEAAKPDLILLSVGISDYRNEAFKLDYADDDAEAVLKAFRSQQGKVFARVKTKLLPVTGQPADRLRIIRALDWLKREGTQRDLRIIFLSGHGGLDSQDNYYFFSEEHDPREDFDAYNIRWSKLLEALTAAAGKAILMVDSCHAARAAGGGRRKSTVNFDEVLRQITNRYGGVVTFAASTGIEASVERDEWQHGAFTKALLEGLEGRADGYGGKKDGVIETKELGAWVIDRVKELTGGEQHAQYLPPPDLPPFGLAVVP